MAQVSINYAKVPYKSITKAGTRIITLQNNLFGNDQNLLEDAPLPHKIRPTSTEDYVGFGDLLKKYSYLQKAEIPSLVIWGPPGCGKTTLAEVLARRSKLNFERFSAVLGGIPELKKIIAHIEERKSLYQEKSLLFIDEIHRFNKSQQDALLPHVESGSFILVGATTENPRSSLNRALLSRVQIIELKGHDHDQVVQILKRALTFNEDKSIEVSEEELSLIADFCDRDARKALNNLELLFDLKREDDYKLERFKEVILENARSYDKNQDRHYDVISAFIKSMRGSDPDAAILWLAVMLDGGEDPVFIARRLVIFASEDVGNADIGALNLAVNCLQVVSQIGMPEARITLAQAVTYLASTVKSNKAYEAINSALDYVKSNETIHVPLHLKNFPPYSHPVKYIYPQGLPGNFINQQYAPVETPQFYRPSDNGVEKNIKERLKNLWKGLKKYE